MIAWEKSFFDWWTDYDGDKMVSEWIIDQLEIEESLIPTCKAWFEVAYRAGFVAAADWPLPPTPDAQGIEAQRAETVEQGSVHKSPVGEQPMRPKDTA